jgi:hypothetical protein
MAAFHFKVLGPSHLLFRRKLHLFNFLFSDAARQLSCLQLEPADIWEAATDLPPVEGMVQVRVSRELTARDPSLSPLPQPVALTTAGLLPTAALERGLTGGRAVSGVRYRLPGAHSSEWRRCTVERGAVLPPPGGWAQGADFVVFAAPEEATGNAETDAMGTRFYILEKRLQYESELRERLARRVGELELAVGQMGLAVLQLERCKRVQ